MLFNSLEFALFLPVVFFIYWFVVRENLKARNILMLAASYVFYGWWDWRLVFLLAGATLVNQALGVRIHHALSGRRGGGPPCSSAGSRSPGASGAGGLEGRSG